MSSLRVNCLTISGGQISVVCVATRLWTGRAGVAILAGSRFLPFLQNFQTGCGAHPAPWEIGTGVLSRSKAVGA